MSKVEWLSVIVPVYNEEENIQPLHHALKQSLLLYKHRYEIVYVDDGSTDATFSKLESIMREDAHTFVVQLSRNFGQTAAIDAGIVHSNGNILVMMDGDLQNDPQDILRLVQKLNDGYDVVSGWRRRRKDARFSRRLPSWLANRLISFVTGVHLHDYGCTLKAYRSAVFDHIHLYGDMHRFLPAYAALYGAKITELEVTHYPRRFGTSKYGMSRTIRVILDLFNLKFQGNWGTRPIHGYGILGILWILLSFLLSLFALRRKPYSDVGTNRLILLSNSITCLGFGGICICIGLLAEGVMRIYHETQASPPYVVKAVFSKEKLAELQEKSLLKGFKGVVVREERG